MIYLVVGLIALVIGIIVGVAVDKTPLPYELERAFDYREMERIIEYKLMIYPYNNYSIVAERIKNQELNMKLDYLEYELKSLKKKIKEDK